MPAAQHIEVQRTTWQGPIPPPDILQGYEDIVPGAAERLLQMAEAQSAHRIQLEKAVVAGDIKSGYWGLAAGFILSALVIGGGIYLIATGHDWAGSVLIGLNLIGLAGVFVYGARNLRATRNGQADPVEQNRN